MLLALLVALVIGGTVGAVNGWLVAFRGLEPFIVTLGMLALARGLVYAYGNGIPITPEAAATFAADRADHGRSASRCWPSSGS